MIDTTTVGKGIAFLRKQKQMTQQGLAAAVNVSHQAVSKWENGAALPDMQTMLALSRMFGVSMEDILSGAVLEAVAPEVQMEEPRIELKLNAEPLNMNLVAEAEEAIDRAMEQCEEIPSEAPEAEEAPQGSVNVGMHFDEIVRMAPFVSDDTLDAMLSNCEDECGMAEIAAIAPFASKETLERMATGCRSVDWSALRRLAPFLQQDTLYAVLQQHLDEIDLFELCRIAPFIRRDSLADILRSMPEISNIGAMKRLAPFMSKEALAEQLQRCVDRLTVDDVIAFAPFLKKEHISELIGQMNHPISRAQMLRLARFLPREHMDRLVNRMIGKDRTRKAEWDVTVDLGRAYQEIRDAVHTGVQEAREAIRAVGLDGVVEGINSTMKDVGGKINEAFNNAWNPQRPDPAQERSRRIRTRIAEKALADGNWDWIENHISEIDGDLLKNVLMKCAAADKAHLIHEHLDRIVLNSAERCRLAQTVVDEELWEILLAEMEPEHARRVLEYIAQVQPEAYTRFADLAHTKSQVEIALEMLCGGEDAAEAVANLGDAEQLELLEAALQAPDCDIEVLLENIALQNLMQALEMLLNAGNTEHITLLAGRAGESALPQMALMLAKHGAWENLDELLDGVADVDLSAVWPIAVEEERWEWIDDIALHGDEATLRGMAQALAEKGRFDTLESFIEELDPETLEMLLDQAMEQSDWDAIERIGELLN